MEKPFWKTTTLAQMTQAQWESLCDGCGRCCLNKLEDWETGELYWTNVACHMLDGHSCRCKDYANRLDHVPDCIQLDAQMINELEWLPPSCAYRLVNEGKDLYPWHPLISGNPESVHEAGISARGRSIPDTGITVDDYEDFIVKWPGEMPGKKRARKVRERG
jgi:uncharacterized protein